MIFKLFLALATSLTFFLCGCIQQSPLVQFRLLAERGSSSSSVATGWQSPVTIDNGAFDVNNDLATSCTQIFGARGCTQPPPVIYSDNRWFVGFDQDSANTTPTKYSLFANMTSLTTKLFGTLGNGLSAIDNGSGTNTAVTVASARYAQFAKLSNGDVAAVFWVHDGPVNQRRVFANVYSTVTKSWGTATRLSTAGNIATDVATDFNATLTPFCRPTVAASGNTAMAAWCEADGASAGSHVVYSTYSNGSWSTSPTEVANSTTLAYPGFSAVIQTFTGELVAGDIVSASLASTTTVRDIATVLAVSQTPLSGQFQIVTDGATGRVLMCPTMKNMITAILSKTVGGSRTLSTRKVSMVLDPACTDNSTTNNYRISMYFNRALQKIYRTVSGASPTDVVSGFTTTSTTLTLGAASSFATQNAARLSGLVALAGDGYGNFGLVRSLPAPWFDTTTATTSGVSEARMLVGHEYINNSGWILSGESIATTQAAPTPVSQDPVCETGSSSSPYTACSVRSPAFVLSPRGSGLVLFYQNQIQNPNTLTNTIANPRNPTRLYFAPYSTATGFTTAAYPLDQDTLCLANSVVNDTSVCEAQAPTTPQSSPNTWTQSACQSMSEPSTSFSLTLNPAGASLTHDVHPPAVAINDRGEAIVAYHKPYSNGTSCSNIGTFVAIYDALNGFGNVKQIDSAVGDTLHAQIAINNKGDAAVVYEENTCATTTASCHLIYLRQYTNGQWQTAKLINTGNTDFESNSMMPSVGLNDDGAVVVTYTATTSGKRRLYAVQYIK